MGIVYDKFRGAWLDRDAETYMSCLHTEYEFHLHSNGRKSPLQIMMLIGF